MSVNISNFSGEQRQALLDLLVLGMYADRHLALAEDARVHRLLTLMEISSGSERQRQFDGAVARVRLRAETPEAGAAQAVILAQKFTTRELRNVACNLLEELMGSDRKISPEEARFLSVVKDLLQT